MYRRAFLEVLEVMLEQRLGGFWSVYARALHALGHTPRSAAEHANLQSENIFHTNVNIHLFYWTIPPIKEEEL